NAAKVRKAVVAAAGKKRAATLEIATLKPRDWVAASLAGLPPVHAGRFIVHGMHDRGRVPVNRIAIEIPAALAFGTGHRGTTQGCLLAIDAVAKRESSKKILDLGTGSGVLAIAAAKIFRRKVLAGDIDRRVVQIARDNARFNHVGALVKSV